MTVGDRRRGPREGCHFCAREAAHKENQEENKRVVSTPSDAGGEMKECVERGKILSRCQARLESRDCQIFGLLQGPCEQDGSWSM